MEFFLEKKVCIVGTGFCGYTAYKKLSKQNIDLIVLEGGEIKNPSTIEDQLFYKFSHNNYVADININGKISKIKSNINLSLRDRQLTLGGSSGSWAGFIKPFEASTYLNKFYQGETYSWGNFNLQKFDKESLKLLKSPILNFEPEKLANSLNLKLPELPQGLHYTVYSWAKSSLRLKDFWINKATSDPNKISSDNEVLYGFVLVDGFIKDGKISHLEFRSHNHKLIVKADLFILGMGGVENARFAEILNSKNKKDRDIKANIGNFQEHPHIYKIGSFDYGHKKIPDILLNRTPYFVKGEMVGYIKFNIVAWNGIGTPKVSFDIYKRNSNNRIDSLLNYVKSKIMGELNITMRCEQTPNKNSKLIFDKNRVNWNVLESDFKIYSEYLRKYISYLNFTGMAKNFKLLHKDSKYGFAFPLEINGGAHHMGTVPISQNGSVIGNNFRHKKFSNLYIVGSSGFPTSGFENPTQASIATTLAAVEDIINSQKF